MSTSRRYEVKKKRQAVRRLSQGSRQGLPSPQGDGKFSFKKLSPEEYAEKKRRVQQRLGALGSSARNKGNAKEASRKADNPHTWIRGDLRNKISPRKGAVNQRQENVAPGEMQFQTKIESKPLITSDSKPPQLSDAKKLTSFNPFAAALQGSTAPPEKAGNKPQKGDSTIFDAPLSKNRKSLAIGTEENIKIGKSLFTDVVQNFPITTTKDSASSVFTSVPSVGTNPFLLVQPKGVTEVPSTASKQSDQPSASSVPFSVPPFSKPDAPVTDAGTNPFASALQVFKSKEKEPEVTNKAVMDVKPRESRTAFNPFQTSQEISTAVSTIFQPPMTASKLSTAIIPAMAARPSSTPFSQDAAATTESTSIKLMGLPDDLNNKEFLRGFFSQFGDVKRVYSHPFTKSAIITFHNHDSAAAAKANGTVLHEGQPPISIFWLKAKNAKALIAKDESMSESSEISDAEVQPKPILQQPKVIQSSSSASLKKSTFKKMVLDFVSTLKSTPARDANEKAEMLEKIDQKIREGIKKETDLKKASLLIGTCPDICPEKERYLREFQQRLAVYEVKSGTESADTMSGQYPIADQFKAVKEYSRSSADQEEPLPHELRPASTLQLTMNYLMLNVMDAGERNWADWYDFVWNRTRGIRKDITQQHLCDESSIDLIEKCARFHIICAHHLCEENINAFDPKINNENLIKCLQSLKHMYEDIYDQKGKICPNEAEFRCYQILLNLNNGDILREVTEFRHGVRESQEVKFALEVFRALNSTNYVRFFKLLNAGSYLMACIMQRYFNQIRSMALFIMNKAYCGMNKPVPIPLSEIARLFAIDEIDEASEFCEHYGFQVDDGMVYFSKSSYIEPESNFLPVRNGVIERKRTCSFGEVVNGKPLSNIQYTPTNSFDENGYYNGVYHELALKGIRRASDQTSEQGLQIPYISETDSGSDRAVQSPMKVAKDDIKASCIALLIPVINQEVYKVATETMQSVQETLVCANDLVDEIIEGTVRAELNAYLQREIHQSKLDQMAKDIFGDIFNQVTESQIREIVTAEFEVEKQKKDDARKMEVFQLTTEISKDILWKSVDVNLRSVASNAIKAERQENHLKIISQASIISGRELLEDFLTKEMRNISGQAIASEVKERKGKLEKLKQKVMILRTGRILKRWIRELETRRHIRETLHDFPACRPLKSSPEMIHALTRHSSHAANLPDYVTLTNGVELTVSSVSSLERRRGQHRNAVEKFHQQILSERRELTRPVDPKPLLNVMAKRLKRSQTRELYSKLVVSVPEPMKSSKSSVVNAELLKKKFKMDLETFDLDEDIGIPSLDTHYRTTEMVQNGVVSLCVKGLSGVFAEDVDMIRETRELFGMTGIIFALEVDKYQTWTEEYERLSRIFTLKPSTPAIPLLVIAIGNSQTDNVEDIIGNLQLKKIKQERKISDYEVLIIDHEIDGIKLNQELNYGLISLVAQTPENPKLQVKTLANFIEEGMQVNFFDGLHRERMKRRDASLHAMDGKPIVDLYNSVLNHLSSVCTHQSLLEISWPTKENTRENVKDCPNLHWNDENTIIQIRAILDSLKLPELDTDADSGGDWDEQQRSCLEYLYRIMSSSSFGAHPSELISRVERVINQYITKWKYRSYDHAIDFPWSLILEECTHFLLASIHKPRSDVNGQMVVCYFKEHWYSFRPPNSWIEHKDFSRWNSSKENLSMSQNLNSSSRDEYIERSIREVDESFTVIEQSLSLVREPLDVSDATSPLQDLLKKQKSLENSLNMERVAYLRLSDRSAMLARDFAPDLDAPLSGVKRKRTTDTLREPKRIPSVPLRKTNSVESLHHDLKRPKKLLESRIDDLLNEVKSMRSAIDLDQIRYSEVMNS